MPITGISPTRSTSVDRAALLIPAALAAVSLLVMSLGELKPVDSWNWLDVAGEGLGVVFGAAWLYLVLYTRPWSIAIRYLSIGILSFLVSLHLDWMDEFVRFPAGMLADDLLESFGMPLGMLLLSVGFWHWRNEQDALGGQLLRREGLERNYRAIDSVTRLYDAGYMRHQLDQWRAGGRVGLAVAMIDVSGFGEINHRHGFGKGDRLLRLIADILLMNVADGDLVCRYAGDRFVVLMRDGSAKAERARHLERCIECALPVFAHPFVGDDPRNRVSARSVTLSVSDAPARQLLREASRRLDTSGNG